MESLKAQFLTPLEIISGQPENRNIFERSLNLMYVNSLIVKKKYEESESYFSPDIFQPPIIESRLWFFTQIHYWTQIKEYDKAKQSLLNRIEKFHRDEALYKLLQYVLWAEFTDCRELWDLKENPDVSAPAPADSLSKLKDLISKETFSSKDLDYQYWRLRDLNAAFKKNVGAKSYKELADLRIFADEINDLLAAAEHGPLEFLFLESPSMAFQSFHLADQNFKVRFFNKSSLCYYLYWLKENSGTEHSGDMPGGSVEQNAEKPELTSFYAASLLSSKDVSDCLSYISLSKGIYGAYLVDSSGYPIARGQGSTQVILKVGLKLLSQFQKQQVQIYADLEEETGQCLYFTQNMFFQILKVGKNYLVFSGEAQRFDLLKPSFQRCREAVEKLHRNANPNSRLLRLSKMDSVIGLCLIKNLENTGELRWKGEEPKDLNVVEMLVRLHNYAQSAHFEKFQQFILGSKSVIIFGRRVGTKFLIVLADKSVELGLIRWEMRKALEME